MPEISIIVPVYNAENYLDNCIKSILNQTFEDFELILVNDGSTDKSSHICNYYKKIDSRIKLINKKNGGVSSARNKGLEVAIGKYIGFVDSDDYIHPKMYETLYNYIIAMQECQSPAGGTGQRDDVRRPGNPLIYVQILYIII